MAIDLPAIGQPLDVEYIYQMINEINTLSTKISNTSDRISAITIPGGTTFYSRTGDLKVVAGYTTVSSGGTTITAGQSLDWRHNFNQEFSRVPVVTATPVNTGASGSTLDATIAITSITTKSVDGKLTFHTTGAVSVNVSVIAIGVGANSSTNPSG